MASFYGAIWLTVLATLLVLGTNPPTSPMVENTRGDLLNVVMHVYTPCRSGTKPTNGTILVGWFNGEAVYTTSDQPYLPLASYELRGFVPVCR